MAPLAVIHGERNIHMTSAAEIAVYIPFHGKEKPRKLFSYRGLDFLERETGFEPATSTLARSHSTTELFPLNELSLITNEAF